MKCEEVAERLSAYVDLEMGEEERLRIAAHCELCEVCRKLTAQFVAIGTLMRQSEPCVDTDAVWDRVSPGLEQQSVVLAPSHANSRNWMVAFLGMAATVAIFWFVMRNDPSSHDGVHEHDHAALAVDFQEVIESAKLNPKAALGKLVSKYQGRELDKKSATAYLGYEPTLFQSVPDGFARVSTHVLNMPCCKCSATICERSDGSSLIVFEHKDEQPVWFGDSPSIETQCGGKTCKIVESAGQLAVSWKNEDRQLTLIGVNDIAEVNQWVSSLEL
jgi:hypothetical protein